MWWYSLGLVGCLFGLTALVLYPLRRRKGLALGMGLGTVIVGVLCYAQFGDGSLWRAHFKQQIHAEEAQKVLKSFKNKAEVIQALKSRLKHTPDSAQGWYLLGRLYASQGEWKEASESFNEAHRLAPAKLSYFVEYAVALWQLSHQQMTPSIRALFQQILAKDPKQADALMFLAMDAYKRHQSQEAIQYWTRLLALVPPGSKDALMIEQAIEQAQGQGQ